MEVIDHNPDYWFLMRDNDDEYLSVRCQRLFAEFEMLIHLTPAERESCQAMGAPYIDALALQVNDHPDRFRERDFEKQLGARVTQGVIAWRSASEATRSPNSEQS